MKPRRAKDSPWPGEANCNPSYFRTDLPRSSCVVEVTTKPASSGAERGVPKRAPPLWEAEGSFGAWRPWQKRAGGGGGSCLEGCGREC